jgi:diguanylate cyclase (GGDEF)-like protein/PAS domain S-box-containing protein
VTTSLPELRRPGSDTLVVMLLRSSIMLFMVGRQILTLRENRQLTDRLDQRVTERTAELRANEQRFAALVQHSSDVVSIIDLDGCIHYQSKSSFEVLGYHPEELIGTSIVRLLDDMSADRLQAAMTKVVDRALHSSVVELNVVHADGRIGVVEMTVTNLLAEPSVQGLVLNSRDISERKKLEDELVHQAFHDPLTGLANRALFQDRVEHALRRWQDGTVAIVFLDLDGFKEINDSLGHAAGDLLLSEVADRLRSCVRHGDTVSRFGGDEFAVLIDDINHDVDPAGLAEHISERFSAGFVIEGREIEIRASAGIALCEGPDTTVGQLLRNADLAMYRAKMTRPGSYVTYDPEMHASLVERLELESDLRRAVREGQLEVYYQPTVAVDTERLVSMEALVRWRHSKRGFVPPLAFIPLAEQSGLIHEIGRQVLETACHQLARWRTTYPSFSALTVSVNVSGRQLQRDDFVDEVSGILAASGLDPRGLVLELTESILLEDTEGSLTKLRRLKSMGIKLALDDFGTGYSSLSYLHRFPIDVLKIDKSFVDLLGLGTDQQEIVQTIVQLGANLRMYTVAEGVEHESQMLALRRLGCHYAQGFHFAEAVPPEQIEPMLAALELNLSA